MLPRIFELERTSVLQTFRKASFRNKISIRVPVYKSSKKRTLAPTLDLPSLLRIFREPLYPWSSPAPRSRWAFEAQSVRRTWVVQERSAPCGPVNTKHDLVLCLVSQVKQTLWLALGLGQVTYPLRYSDSSSGKSKPTSAVWFKDYSAWAYFKYLILLVVPQRPNSMEL